MQLRYLVIGWALLILLAPDLSAQLSTCPGSPNCVSTLSKKKRKRLPALPFIRDLDHSKVLLKKLLASETNYTLEEEETVVLKYVVVTGIGKFKDDLTFWFDVEQGVIHFRSASRKGWHDMGANRRRMKKWNKKWQELLSSEEHL